MKYLSPRSMSALTHVSLQNEGCFGQFSAFRPNFIATSLFDSLTSIAIIAESLGFDSRIFISIEIMPTARYVERQIISFQSAGQKFQQDIVEDIRLFHIHEMRSIGDYFQYR